MNSAPSTLWVLVGSVAAVYLLLPVFLHQLQATEHELFIQIGAPRFSQICSRNPQHWRVQIRLLWFMVSGHAFAKTHGKLRILSAFLMVAELAMLVSLLATVVYVIFSA